MDVDYRQLRVGKYIALYSMAFISITMIPFNTKSSKEESSWQESLPLFHISHNGLQGFRLTGNSNFKLY